MQLSDYGDLFLSESREHLSAINQNLLLLEAAPNALGPVEEVFRAVHTIKGMAATMGYRSVAELAHELEDLLDRVRKGECSVDSELADLLFQGTDELERLVDRAAADVEEGSESVLVGRLRSAAAASVADHAEPASASTTARPGAAMPPTEALAIEVVVRADCALPGVRAFLALRRARDLGVVTDVAPAEDMLTAEGFGGVVRFRLETEESADAVRAALVDVGDIERVAVVEPQVPSRPAKEAPEAGTGRAVGSIRVDVRRLDALMNGVGELVIVRDRLNQLRPDGDLELGEALDVAARLIGELQEEIVHARLVPVWQVFERFPRLVRDAARFLEKQVELTISGRDIEFDRSVLDELGDPLVHLLRNAVDHGIEPPEERRRAGKPESGTIHLSASRERSRVVVRVEDDGRGVDRERVRAKAVSLGLIAADATLTEDETLGLLMQPGFSTAATVSDVSGRGVGLDVVATRVRALGGTLDIESQPGRGTVFTLRLPLSLAIVRALLVRVGDERYAIPLTHVAEAVELRRDNLRRVGGRTVATLRDEVFSIIDLAALLASSPEDLPSFTAVVLDLGDRPLALRVDELVGQQEIVVKAFDSTTCTPRLFSGATILSDGRPALILDVGSVAAHAGDAAAA